MQRIIQTTADGSHTIAIPHMQVTYHSVHGAAQESRHVFIQAGLQPLLHKYKTLKIFEMGFGTGLNALLTLKEAMGKEQPVWYECVEQFPLLIEEVLQLNYTAFATPALFEVLHTANWNEAVVIHPYFTLYKLHCALQQFTTGNFFHLIYYDAFAPSAQPELWATAIFKKLYTMLHINGVLVTYCSKGDVRRSMIAAGFSVEKLPGPPGKREMLRGVKLL